MQEVNKVIYTFYMLKINKILLAVKSWENKFKKKRERKSR